MTQLRLRVTATNTDTAIALLHRLEDVAISRHTKGTVEGKTVIMDIDEKDVFAIKQVLAYYRSWIATN